MTVEEHHSAEELERLFREEKSARMAKRIWIVWQARLGRTEPEITAEISLARRTVQQCVRCYNTAGLAGLQGVCGTPGSCRPRPEAASFAHGRNALPTANRSGTATQR